MAEMTAEERLFNELPFTADRLILLANAALREAAETAAREERERCCRDMCWRCREGSPASKDEYGGWRHSDSNWDVPCGAHAIRARAKP